MEQDGKHKVQNTLLRKSVTAQCFEGSSRVGYDSHKVFDSHQQEANEYNKNLGLFRKSALAWYNHESFVPLKKWEFSELFKVLKEEACLFTPSYIVVPLVKEKFASEIKNLKRYKNKIFEDKYLEMELSNENPISWLLEFLSINSSLLNNSKNDYMENTPLGLNSSFEVFEGLDLCKQAALRQQYLESLEIIELGGYYGSKGLDMHEPYWNEKLWELFSDFMDNNIDSIESSMNCYSESQVWIEGINEQNSPAAGLHIASIFCRDQRSAAKLKYLKMLEGSSPRLDDMGRMPAISINDVNVSWFDDKRDNFEDIQEAEDSYYENDNSTFHKSQTHRTETVISRERYTDDRAQDYSRSEHFIIGNTDYIQPVLLKDYSSNTTPLSKDLNLKTIEKKKESKVLRKSPQISTSFQQAWPILSQEPEEKNSIEFNNFITKNENPLKDRDLLSAKCLLNSNLSQVKPWESYLLEGVKNSNRYSNGQIKSIRNYTDKGSSYHQRDSSNSKGGVTTTDRESQSNIASELAEAEHYYKFTKVKDTHMKPHQLRNEEKMKGVAEGGSSTVISTFKANLNAIRGSDAAEYCNKNLSLQWLESEPPVRKRSLLTTSKVVKKNQNLDIIPNSMNFKKSDIIPVMEVNLHAKSPRMMIKSPKAWISQEDRSFSNTSASVQQYKAKSRTKIALENINNNKKQSDYNISNISSSAAAQKLEANQLIDHLISAVKQLQKIRENLLKIDYGYSGTKVSSALSEAIEILRNEVVCSGKSLNGKSFNEKKVFISSQAANRYRKSKWDNEDEVLWQRFPSKSQKSRDKSHHTICKYKDKNRIRYSNNIEIPVERAWAYSKWKSFSKLTKYKKSPKKQEKANYVSFEWKPLRHESLKKNGKTPSQQLENGEEVISTTESRAKLIVKLKEVVNMNRIKTHNLRNMFDVAKSDTERERDKILVAQNFIKNPCRQEYKRQSFEKAFFSKENGSNCNERKEIELKSNLELDNDNKDMNYKDSNYKDSCIRSKTSGINLAASLNSNGTIGVESGCYTSRVAWKAKPCR